MQLLLLDVLSRFQHTDCFISHGANTDHRMVLKIEEQSCNIFWFKLHHCEDLLLFFVLYDCKLIILKFGLVGR